MTTSDNAATIRSFIAYDFALIDGTSFANVLEDARDTQPAGLDIHYPGDDGSPNVQGTIWGSLVKEEIDNADKFIAFVDLPNANVGFEIGYACGTETPVGVYRFKDTEHPWLKKHPLRGHFRYQAKDDEAVHKAFLEDELITITKKPNGGDGVAVLCPSDGKPFVRQIDPSWGWKTPALDSWSLDDDLPKQFEDAGLVVWIITPHGQGDAERDGTENTCLSILAGYTEARPELQLRIFIHTGARPVADMEHYSKQFTTNAELKGHLEALEKEWSDIVASRNAPPSPAVQAVPLELARPSSKPEELSPHPEDVFQHDEALFIGRESELKTGAESVAGLMGRFGPGTDSADSGFKLIWSYGFGGMGKSWYLHRIRCRAEATHPNICSLVVDWDKPEWRSPLVGEPRVDSDLFDVIATRLCQRLGLDAADAYWQAKDQVVAVREEHRREMERFSDQFHIAITEESPRLEAHFQQQLIAESLWEDDLPRREKKLAIIQKDQARYRELFSAWCRETGHTDVAIICPGRARADGLSRALRAAMTKHPLILLLDTCEILSRDLDGWLRELVAPLLRESLPLLVLVGSRLRPDLHQPTGSRRGWRVEIPQVQLNPLDFGEGRRFTVTEIESAVSRLTRSYSGDVASLSEYLHRVTLGIPLAVRALLDMHNEGADVLENLPEPDEDERPLSTRDEVRKVIDAVAARFLLNLTNYPEREDDLRDIIALALLPEYDHAILCEFWPGKPVDRIRRLSQRYSLLSDGDLHPSVRSFLRRHWRQAERPSVFDDVLSTLQSSSAAVQKVESPATSAQHTAHLVDEFNLRSWSEGDALVDGIARALCVARVYETDSIGLESLLAELPLEGDTHAAARKLWHRDQEERLSNVELISWLKAQCTSSRSWSDEERAGLALLDGLATSTRPNSPDKALAAYAALEQAVAVFGIEALPQSAPAGDAYFDCGWSLAPRRADSDSWVSQSVDCYERAIALCSSKATAHNNVANLYNDHFEQPEKAEEEYLAAIALDPKFATPHYGLGIIYETQLEPEKAEEEYLAAIALDPQYVHPHNGLGNLYQFYLEQPEKAEEEYRAAIALDPKYANPHNGLGSLYEEAGRWSDATAEFEEVTKLEGSTAGGLRGQGWVELLSRGDIAKARRWAKEAVTVDPKHPGALLATIAVDAWAGEWKDAAEAFADWVRDWPKGFVWFPWTSRCRLAAVLRKAMEAEQLNAFEKALTSVSTHWSWQPWAEAVKALVSGSDSSTLTLKTAMGPL